MNFGEAYTPREARHSIGDAITFIPSAFVRYEELPGIPVTLKGVVAYVNEAHRYYTVEAECWGYRLRECFKF